jgi:bifunctional non-homologous end joining protein LigD
MKKRTRTSPQRTSRTGDQLTEYRRKRDFGRTREPAGDTARSRAGRLAFVIQKHAATALHYDLRLELDGVMKSWAVPRGPALDSSIKRLSMQVEDHPIEYNTFEGTIPQGEYGGGTVMLWDRGTYTPDERKRSESDEDAGRRGLRAGKLSFTFHGERLQGSFTLVRTDSGPKPKWLLIKHRDDDATSSLDITREVVTSVATGRTMDEIAREGDRVWHSNRHGSEGGEGQRSVEPPAAIIPMKPTPSAAMPDEGEWTFEPWRGGERVLAYATAEIATMLDASGHDLTAQHGTLARELASLAQRVGRPFVAEGELTGSARNAELYITDLLIDGERALVDEPWRTRSKALHSLLHRRRLERLHRQDTDPGGERVLRRASDEGWPGIIARNLATPYQPGRRSEGFLRIATH